MKSGIVDDIGKEKGSHNLWNKALCTIEQEQPEDLSVFEKMLSPGCDEEIRIYRVLGVEFIQTNSWCFTLVCGR